MTDYIKLYEENSSNPLFLYFIMGILKLNSFLE